jgi:hypothetical protein
MKNNLRLQEQRELCSLVIDTITLALSLVDFKVTNEDVELLQNRTGLGGVEPRSQWQALSLGSQSYASGVERRLKAALDEFIRQAGREALAVA